MVSGRTGGTVTGKGRREEERGCARRSQEHSFTGKHSTVRAKNGLQGSAQVKRKRGGDSGRGSRGAGGGKNAVFQAKHASELKQPEKKKALEIGTRRGHKRRKSTQGRMGENSLTAAKPHHLKKTGKKKKNGN